MLPMFDYLKPRSLDDALALIATTPKAFPIAGGTNLLVDVRSGKVQPEALVEVGFLDELCGIRKEGGEIVIGAGTTIAELLSDPMIESQLPVLHAASTTFANTLIRNRATIGGNLANNAPCADTAPALLVLDASVELASVRGKRSIKLEEFLTSPFETVRAVDELILAVRVSVPPRAAIGRFRKMGLRKISCMAKVDVAVLLDFNSEGICVDARIAMGAASPVARRAVDAEATLVGNPLHPERIRRAADQTAQAAVPRPGSEYKQQVVRSMVTKLLDDIAREGGDRRG